ncbi:unnamed protein product [Onchocerca ochengi]|uniref:Fibrinogen C-terminal domain-containing protein n=1 Tax=Onchocerca ochengi TaxID=42157 RepID=A0A182E4G0_ONCOC|nr:unnamed protein product [Onchocerca ochengi]
MCVYVRMPAHVRAYVRACVCVHMYVPMSSTSIGQLMADMRQLVINLQTRERATDNALAKSQIVNDKISGMKEYQDEVANMNDCWRMQGRKVLVAGLQHENRQILQLQQENRELRQALEDCENTLQLVMQKHRDVVTKLAKQFIPPFRILQENKKCETSINEKIVNLSRLLNECLADGESISNHDQELIARLTTENACLRELLNISTYNEPNIARNFLDITSAEKPNYSNGLTAVYDKNCEQSKEKAFKNWGAGVSSVHLYTSYSRKEHSVRTYHTFCDILKYDDVGASTPTGNSFLHNKEDIRQNSVLVVFDFI